MISNLRTLSAPLQEKAIRELNEDPSQIQTHLELFKEWLRQQEYLKYNDNDQFLLNFLRSSKYSLERAKSKLDAFYTFRTIAPELSLNMDPLSPAMQSHLELTSGVPLPIPRNNPTAPRVVFIRYNDIDTDKLHVVDILKGEIMAINVLVNTDDNYVVSGAIMIWDFSRIKLKTALQATPTFLRKMVFCFENAFPTRLKSVYIINAPKFLEQIVNLVRSIISKKLSKRLQIYSSNNLDAIFKDLPKSIFPNEYGGEAGCYEELRAKWKKTIESHRELLINENNYYSDESKRPEKTSTFENIFGMDGSFKSLQID